MPVVSREMVADDILMEPSPWRKIDTFDLGDNVKCDLWMQWGASALTMGWGDSFRVVDCYHEDGKWFHYHEGKFKELQSDYLTHWMPRPRGPDNERHYDTM
jgi:hypothetical protein